MDAATRIKAWEERKLNSIRAYNDAEGNTLKARKVLRAKYRAIGLDPMTIILLIQIAWKIYVWAKEQGYLSSIDTQIVASMPAFGDEDFQFAMEPDDDA